MELKNLKTLLIATTILSLMLVACGGQEDASTTDSSSSKQGVASKSPEEYASLKCDYLTKEKLAKDANNDTEKDKYDDLGDKVSEEVRKVFKDDSLKLSTFFHLVSECRKSLKK